MFNIDGDQWTLDLRPESGKGSVMKGAPSDKPDLTLTISDENFVKLVMGKLNPQQVGVCGSVYQHSWQAAGSRSNTFAAGYNSEHRAAL